MLSGHFENCYGIKRLTLPDISFKPCNKAIIYAPNGVMKSSFAKVFEDISKGAQSSDRIFRGLRTSYSITHYASKYVFPPAQDEEVCKSKNIYVINSFTDKIEFTKETVSTLLADEDTLNCYDETMAQFKGTVSEIESKLRVITGLAKPKIKSSLIADLKLSQTADWPDIIEALGQIQGQQLEFLDEIKYTELFNDKAMAVYSNADFRRNITEYIDSLETLLHSSSLLNDQFNERSAEELSKSLASHNIFAANHKILLRDGTLVESLEDWKRLVQAELNELYQAPALAKTFEELKKLFSKNADSVRVRDIIATHREIIPFLRDIPSLKLQTWFNCFSRLDKPFDEYYRIITAFTEQIRALYEQASTNSARWVEVVDEFNRRFRVPFKVKIINKSNFILKDEAPNIEFEYFRGHGEQQETVELKTDELKDYLSMGERRALYLLYILFDLEKLRKQAQEGGGQYLIIADDISDSFDYKNKYAIIEYLNDLAAIAGIDLLILTHNFDFYRTIMFRLNVSRSNCLIAQRDDKGVINIKEFRYQRDFFKNTIRAAIASGMIDTDAKKKCLVASIPFYRNLAEYSGDVEAYSKLTCFLHYKSSPFSTDNLMMSNLWSTIQPFLKSKPLNSTDVSYWYLLNYLAKSILNDDDEVSLENKLVLSIASRTSIEKFMKRRIEEHMGACKDADGNQTREWYNISKPYLNDAEIKVIEEVNLVTPESIHLNAFMYEPLIDVSIWNLKDLYRRAVALLQ